MQRLSISVLTYNRANILRNSLLFLKDLKYENLEILLVDNGSSDGTPEMVAKNFPEVKLSHLPRNIGTGARNVGIINATGDYIITLDDDILGISDENINEIIWLFNSHPSVAAICFKVIDYYTNEITNWCHPYRLELYSEKEFLTTEITEGAVAFRKSIFDIVGYYPESFFISNEGADLACRILNSESEILYTPSIVVKHKHSAEARKSWRRYYYDTRNHLWLALRNYRPIYSIRYVISRVFIMMIYAIRDGFFCYWLKGVRDSFLGAPAALRQRNVITKLTEKKIIDMNRNKPGMLYMIKKRLKGRGVKI